MEDTTDKLSILLCVKQETMSLRLRNNKRMDCGTMIVFYIINKFCCFCLAEILLYYGAV